MLNVLANEFEAPAPQVDARRNQFLVPLKEQTLPQPEPQTRPVAVRMVVLVGPPGSGKSFVAKLFRERGWEIVVPICHTTHSQLGGEDEHSKSSN